MDHTKSCNHEIVRCLNEFELIRKYECLSCHAVMMCSCDEAIGTTFLSHQLDRGTELETKERVAVTAGFQPGICRECRGLQPEAHPVAAIYGRTSKIKRYYWRELAFREMELFAQWAEENGVSLDVVGAEATEARKLAGKVALDEIKEVHRLTPKYTFSDESQSDVIQEFGVSVVDLKATYLDHSADKKARLLDSNEQLTVEEFVRRHYSRTGYDSMFVESIPFHVLFGTFMWLVIQDPADPRVRIVGFGDRNSTDNGGPGHLVNTHLPEDFGSSGYAQRRHVAIDDHFSQMLGDDADLDFLFRYWLHYSHGLRQYLWAHREKDIETARKIITILPRDAIRRILRYLVDDYWRRYCGWPDLLIYKGEEFFFVEVKASGDKLSDDQKEWIRGNHQILKLPFVLVKVHRANPRGSPLSPSTPLPT